MAKFGKTFEDAKMMKRSDTRDEDLKEDDGEEEEDFLNKSISNMFDAFGGMEASENARKIRNFAKISSNDVLIRRINSKKFFKNSKKFPRPINLTII